MRAHLIIFLSLLIFQCASQDSIFLKDSSIVDGIVKKIQFDSTEYRPSYSAYQSKKIAAEEVAVIIYTNRSYQVINRRYKLRVNFGLSLQLNKTFSNWPYIEPYTGHAPMPGGVKYIPVGLENEYLPGFNLSVNVLGGRRKKKNMLYSLNYSFCRSVYIKESFEREFEMNSFLLSYSKLTRDTITSDYHYLSLLVGPHFSYNDFTIELGGGLKYPVAANSTYSGYIIETTPSTMDIYYHFYHSPHKEINGNLIVFLSAGYDFRINKRQFGLFLSAQVMAKNKSHNNCFLAGVRFYPFAKTNSDIESL